MVEEKKTLRDYAVPSMFGATSCIKKLIINANNFELMTGVIQLIQNQCQFGKLANDDLNEHIKSFLEICNPQKHNGVSANVVHCFFFSSH